MDWEKLWDKEEHTFQGDSDLSIPVSEKLASLPVPPQSHNTLIVLGIIGVALTATVISKSYLRSCEEKRKIEDLKKTEPYFQSYEMKKWNDLANNQIKENKNHELGKPVEVKQIQSTNENVSEQSEPEYT